MLSMLEFGYRVGSREKERDRTDTSEFAVFLERREFAFIGEISQYADVFRSCYIALQQKDYHSLR